MTTTLHRTAACLDQAEPGQPPVVGRGGHRHHGEAQHPRRPAHARGAVLHDAAAHHVHAALHLRLRWGHPRPGRPLHRVPDAGHLRADGHLRRHELGGRAGRGPAQGHHRALPRPADEPLRRAGRPHHLGPGPQRLRGGPDHDRRLRRGLPHRDQLRAVRLRGAGDPVLRLRVELGLRLHRPLGAQRGDGPGHGLPADLPAALRLVGLRPGGHHARLAAGLRRAPAGDPGGERSAVADGRRRRCTTRAPCGRPCCGPSGCWWCWRRSRCASTARWPEAAPTPRRCAGAARRAARRWGPGPARWCRGRGR